MSTHTARSRVVLLWNLVGVPLTVLGLAGIPDDLRTWSGWLSGLGALMDDNAMRWCVTLGGVSVVVLANLPWIRWFGQSLDEDSQWSRFARVPDIAGIAKRVRQLGPRHQPAEKQVNSSQVECRLSDGRIIRFDKSRAQKWDQKQREHGTIGNQTVFSRSDTLWHLESGPWLLEESELKVDSERAENTWREIDHAHAVLWFLSHNEPIPRAFRATIEWHRPPAELAEYLPVALKTAPHLLDAVKDLIPRRFLGNSDMDRASIIDPPNMVEFRKASESLESLLVEVLGAPIIVAGDETSPGDANRKKIIRNSLSRAAEWLEHQAGIIGSTEEILGGLRQGPDGVFRFDGKAYTSAHAAGRLLVQNFYMSAWGWLEDEVDQRDFPRRKLSLELVDQHWDKYLIIARLHPRSPDAEIIGAVIRKERIAVNDICTSIEDRLRENSAKVNELPEQKIVNSSDTAQQGGMRIADKAKRVASAKQRIKELIEDGKKIKGKKQAQEWRDRVIVHLSTLYIDDENEVKFKKHLADLDKSSSYKASVKRGVWFLESIEILVHNNQLNR